MAEIGCNWARIGPSKSSQSLSIAHKWAVEIEPRSEQESPEVETTKEKEMEITKEKEVEFVDKTVEITSDAASLEQENTNDQEVELAKETPLEKLQNRWEKGKIVEDTRNTQSPHQLDPLGIFLNPRIFRYREIPMEKAIDDSIPSQVDASVRSYMSGHILYVHPAQSQTASVPEQQYQLTQVPQTTCKTSAVRPRDQEDPHDDAHPEGENSAKRQKTSEYEAYVSLESSSGQVNEEEPGPSTSSNQEHDDDFDFWTDSYASDDDEIPTKQVSQDIMEEVSLTIDEVKLKKMADEMLRQRCTSGDEHQYHIDQMKNFLQSDIVWESRKEIIVSPHPRKTTPLVLSCQRDPEAPALSLINQDLLYLKKGISGLENIVLSLHKFPAVIFNDDDIEE
ncbi:hypothetical protein Tco_0348980 [Tanacetum coccineum]